MSACGATPGPSPATGSPSQGVADRIPPPACGVEIQEQGGGPWNEAARACFWHAYQAHQPAEFVSTLPTIEGDPITTTYRVLPDGKVEIITDSTRDRYAAPGSLERLVCRTLALVEGGTPSIDFGPDDSCVVAPIT
jgi:hypothetical protein